MDRCRRLRHWLELSIVDVSANTGISAVRLAKAERGKLELNIAEELVLESYYKARWQMAHNDDARDLTILMGGN